MSSVTSNFTVVSSTIANEFKPTNNGRSLTVAANYMPAYRITMVGADRKQIGCTKGQEIATYPTGYLTSCWEWIYVLFTHTKITLNVNTGNGVEAKTVYVNNNSVKKRLGKVALEELKLASRNNQVANEVLKNAYEKSTKHLFIQHTGYFVGD